MLMDIIVEEFSGGLPDGARLTRLFVRMLMAMALGAVIGAQRELSGKPAGLRTHILVAMGSALFILAGIEYGMSPSDMSRVIQGLTAGIGFIGAGAILKLSEWREIKGLTTAAGIWTTAAVGVTVGLGLLGLALVSVVLVWFVLSVLGYLERRMKGSHDRDSTVGDEDEPLQ